MRSPGHGLRAEGGNPNFSSLTAGVGGRPVDLSTKEFNLLAYLVQNAGRVLTHDQILDRVWGMGSYSYASVKQYVSYLRQKIEPDQLTQQPPDRRQPDAGRGDGGAAGANILSKLNVRSRVEVAVWAIEHDSAAARSGERTRS